MGYKLNKGDIYTFHHLIIPKRDGGPYDAWNGAVLCGSTSHPYLHLIESIDRRKFELITYEMIQMNKQGYLDVEHLQNINEILRNFEHEYKNRRGSKGKLLIKQEYLDRIYNIR